MTWDNAVPDKKRDAALRRTFIGTLFGFVGLLMYPPALVSSARHVLEEATIRGLMIAAAESCTGGLIAGLLTEIPGSSVAFERGFVTYSNAAKTEMLGVPAAVLETHGAVSAQTAKAMAVGALTVSHADVSIAVTGIAGPGGGTAEKPVGLVHMAAAGPRDTLIHREMRYGELPRDIIRMKTIADAIDLIFHLLRGLPGKVYG